MMIPTTQMADVLVMLSKERVSASNILVIFSPLRL